MSQTAAPVAPHSEQIAANPRLGFAGVGWIGRHRMKALVETGHGDVCAIFEPNQDAAMRARQLAPEAEILASFDEMLRSGIDAVVIATPSALHAQQAVAALERGIAVFCQKPLGRNLAETQRAIDAARSADRLLKVDLSYRFVEAVKRIGHLVHAGDLGRICHIELIFHNAYGPDKPWFYDPKLAGGGCLIDLGIHLVDLALWWLGFPPVEKIDGRLFAKGRRFAGRDIEVEDFASATINLASGTNVQLACSWNAHAGQDAVIEARLFGTKGGARLANVKGSFYDFIAEQFTSTKRNTLAVPPDDWGGRAAVDWLARLCRENGNRFDPSIEHLSAVADVLDRIYEK